LNTPIALWQRQLAEAYSNVDDLCRHLAINPSELPVLPEFRAFPLKVPRGFADCMEKGNPTDPLLRQVLPLSHELQTHPGYNHDPVGDLNAVAQAGVIHKYHGRVLLITTGGCAVHCRYCFRRHFPYGDQQLSARRTTEAVNYIKAHTELKEVILSGGDPLLLSDDKLANLFRQLADIRHIERIRIHSRIPIVLPARVTERFIQILDDLPQQIIMVLHVNHQNELSEDVKKACQRIKQKQITLLNQSVLLQGVNDDDAILCKLSEKLFAYGVLPYYLHYLDKAAGVAHFEVSEHKARQLIQGLQNALPGYLVPKLVMEQSGAAHKIRIA